MPYRRIGKSVYKKSGGKWIKKGTSKDIPTARKYLAVLNMREHGIGPKGKKKGVDLGPVARKRKVRKKS